MRIGLKKKQDEAICSSFYLEADSIDSVLRVHDCEDSGTADKEDVSRCCDRGIRDVGEG